MVHHHSLHQQWWITTAFTRSGESPQPSKPGAQEIVDFVKQLCAALGQLIPGFEVITNTQSHPIHWTQYQTIPIIQFIEPTLAGNLWLPDWVSAAEHHRRPGRCHRHHHHHQQQHHHKSLINQHHHHVHCPGEWQPRPNHHLHSDPWSLPLNCLEYDWLLIYLGFDFQAMKCMDWPGPLLLLAGQ